MGQMIEGKGTDGKKLVLAKGKTKKNRVR